MEEFDCKELKVVSFEKDVPYDIIHDILWIANRDNRNSAGFILKTSTMSPEQLKALCGTNCCSYVVYYRNMPVGTITAKLYDCHSWYCDGKIIEYMLAGVLPEFQNMHIGSMLSKEVFEFSRMHGCKVVRLNTAERNEKAIRVYKHLGFFSVGFRANPGGDHYSIIMVKWLDGCPVNKTALFIRFQLRKLYVKVRYKPGKEKRFGI